MTKTCDVFVEKNLKFCWTKKYAQS